jgi:hypothetical protein
VAEPTRFEELAERLVLERMEFYGYPPGVVRGHAAKMAQGAERGEYHRRYGCELGEHGWECVDPETEQSRHPVEDELTRTSEFVVWVLEQAAVIRAERFADLRRWLDMAERMGRESLEFETTRIRDMLGWP